jgi:hypothetical protein
MSSFSRRRGRCRCRWGLAAVFGAENGAVGSAGPGDSAAYVVDAAEAGGGYGPPAESIDNFQG